MEVDKEYRDLLLEEELEDKLNARNKDVRLTSLKLCNKKIGLYYTMALTETSIKSYLYYVDKKCVMIVECKDWTEMKNAIWLHRRLEVCEDINIIYEIANDIPNKKIFY